MVSNSQRVCPWKQKGYWDNAVTFSCSGCLQGKVTKEAAKSNESYRSRVDTGVVIDWQRVLDAVAEESKKFFVLSMTNRWKEVQNQNFIVDFVYLALVVHLDPLRLVFGEVRVIEHDDPPRDGNIYIRSKRTLVLRVFKTVRTFGEQEYALGDSDLGGGCIQGRTL